MKKFSSFYQVLKEIHNKKWVFCLTVYNSIPGRTFETERYIHVLLSNVMYPFPAQLYRTTSTDNGGVNISARCVHPGGSAQMWRRFQCKRGTGTEAARMREMSRDPVTS